MNVKPIYSMYLVKIRFGKMYVCIGTKQKGILILADFRTIRYWRNYMFIYDHFHFKFLLSAIPSIGFHDVVVFGQGK